MRHCVGMGYDVHGFTPGDHVMLCGVKIPFHKSLHGHSDADVAMHALTDAIYGAIGAGDIGLHFPPSEPKWKGMASEWFLADALKQTKEKSGVLQNVDVTIICEEPKITPHRAAMQERLANILELETRWVNVKATTTEGLSFTGRKEGIAAQAVASVVFSN